MTALICGSFAYDNIMVFPDKFKNHILPEKMHILNVSFMVPDGSLLISDDGAGKLWRISYKQEMRAGNSD